MKKKYESLKFGSVRPQGWMRKLMIHELRDGFIGHLDELVPDLIKHDDIYGKNRLTKEVKSKDVGAIAQDADWEVQYLWWNSETQSNWWDGFVRNALLVDDVLSLKRAEAFIREKINTQDADGYLGIYAPDLRFSTNGENGELWALASLGRILLAWHEATGDQLTLTALERACGVVMQAWPMEFAHPFDCGSSYAGVAHGLAVTDVFHRLWELTGKENYLQYAGFLYRDYSQFHPSEKDIQLHNLLNVDYHFGGHSVHTYEHLRSLLVAIEAASEPERPALEKALEGYLDKLKICICPSGAPIGDEWIRHDGADSSETGYEYCSLHELLDSYCFLLRQTGELRWGDAIEGLLFNAAMGARHPSGDSITYLKTDNCYQLDGTGPSHHDGGASTKQVRYKYSPTHQDAAVCCVPNAGRIFPAYVNAAWLQHGNALIVALYGPNRIETEIDGIKICIEQNTSYPADWSVEFTLLPEKPVAFDLILRQPGWAVKVDVESVGTSCSREAEQIRLHKWWERGDKVRITFEATIREERDRQGDYYLSYGPMVYALPLAARETLGKSHPVQGFQDRYFHVLDDRHLELAYVPGSARSGMDVQIAWDEGVTYPAVEALSGPCIYADFMYARNGVLERRKLLPMGRTILRRVTFPVATEIAD